MGGIEQPIALARRKIGQAIRQKLDAKKVICLCNVANTTFSGIWDQGAAHLRAILWLPSLLPSRAGFFCQNSGCQSDVLYVGGRLEHGEGDAERLPLLLPDRD